MQEKSIFDALFCKYYNNPMPYFTKLPLIKCLILQTILSMTTLDSQLFFIRWHDCIPFCCLAVVIYPIFKSRVNHRYLQSSFPGEVYHVSGSTAFSIPKSNESVRTFSHLCIPDHASCLVKQSPFGRMQFKGKPELIGKSFTKRVCATGMAGDDDDPMCPHFLL